MTLPPPRKTLSQILPSASVIPPLQVEPEIGNRIRKLIFTTLGVGREDECQMAIAAAQSAAAWYVRAKVYETQMPAFRLMISGGKGDLRDAIQALLDLLPATSDAVPFAQLRSLHCYGDPLQMETSKLLWRD